MYEYVLIIGILFLIIFISIKKINGYTITDYINTIYTKYDNKRQEYYKTDLPWCKLLRNNYLTIRDEYMSYNKNNKLKRCKELDDVQALLDLSDIPWEVIILRVYNKDTNNMKYFPKTHELLTSIPGCSFAMFSVLHSGKVLPEHYGPYKGILRYHLGLITPKDGTHCLLTVNGINYRWKEGEDIIFDDTFIHSVINGSNESRVVLLLDIQKELNNLFLNSLNTIFLYLSQFNETVGHLVKKVNA
jgi:beta-hydroxylase